MSYIKKGFIINSLLILVAVTVSYSSARMVRNVLMTQAQSIEMTKKIDVLKQKKQELEAKIAEIKIQEAVEREAKERLNLKKQGEHVVVIVPEEKQQAPIQEHSGFWSRITSFFQ